MYRKLWHIAVICLLITSLFSVASAAKKPVNATSASKALWEQERVHADKLEKYKQQIGEGYRIMGQNQNEMSRLASMMLVVANEDKLDSPYKYRYYKNELSDYLGEEEYFSKINNLPLHHIQFCQPIPSFSNLMTRNVYLAAYFNDEKKGLEKQKKSIHANGLKLTLVALYNAINNPTLDVEDGINSVIKVDGAVNKIEGKYWKGIQYKGDIPTENDIFADGESVQISSREKSVLELKAHIDIADEIVKHSSGNNKTAYGVKQIIADHESAKNYILSDYFMPKLDAYSEDEKVKFTKAKELLVDCYDLKIKSLYSDIERLNRERREEEYKKVEDNYTNYKYIDTGSFWGKLAVGMAKVEATVSKAQIDNETTIIVPDEYKHKTGNYYQIKTELDELITEIENMDNVK